MSTTLTITLNDNGSINVSGPLTNKLICWGMLVAAQDLIRTYEPAEKPLIEIPSFVPPPDVQAQMKAANPTQPTPIVEG